MQRIYSELHDIGVNRVEDWLRDIELDCFQDMTSPLIARHPEGLWALVADSQGLQYVQMCAHPSNERHPIWELHYGPDASVETARTYLMGCVEALCGGHTPDELHFKLIS